jgi:hypothetical protein
MTRGTLPKAYLRMSPNLDQHPDPLGMVLAMCAAGRQTDRGRFESRAVLERILGRRRTRAMLERHDLVVLPDGRLYLDGWDEWQEGDITVGERMRRLRSKPSQRRHHAVTQPSPDRIDASEALGVRRNGREEDDDSGLTAAPKSSRPPLVAVSPSGRPA